MCAVAPLLSHLLPVISSLPSSFAPFLGWVELLPSCGPNQESRDGIRVQKYVYILLGNSIGQVTSQVKGLSDTWRVHPVYNAFGVAEWLPHSIFLTLPRDSRNSGIFALFNLQLQGRKLFLLG